MINEFIRNRYPEVRADDSPMEHWNEMPNLASSIKDDHLFVVITARKGTISYKNAQERLPEELTKYFYGKNLMIIFPEKMDSMTFTEAQHQEERSAYEELSDWLNKKFRRK